MYTVCTDLVVDVKSAEISGFCGTSVTVSQSSLHKIHIEYSLLPFPYHIYVTIYIIYI